MNKPLLIACVALAAVYVSAAPVQTEETIGEWRDYVNDSWDHNLRIVRESDQYTMIITPTRGRVVRRDLIARGDGNWEVRGSADREGTVSTYAAIFFCTTPAAAFGRLRKCSDPWILAATGIVPVLPSRSL